MKDQVVKSLLSLLLLAAPSAVADDVYVAWGANVPLSEIKGVLQNFECKEFANGYPNNTKLIDGDAKFLGCTGSGSSCGGTCTVCSGSTYGVQICVSKEGKECGATGGDGDCGFSIYGQCVNPVSPRPAGTLGAPGGGCDCQIGTAPTPSTDKCKVRLCLL